MSALFISYASADQAIALEVCALLEARGVSCWIAPRDVAPGSKWDESILDAIESASAFLLVLTTAANASSYVSNEVNEAFEKKKPIFTFRAEDVTPGKSLKFYLGRHHWIDGFGGRIEDRAEQLATSVATLVGASGGVGEGVAVAVRPAVKRAAKVVTRAVRRERLAWIAAGTLAITVAVLAFPAMRGLRAAPDTPLYVSLEAPPGTVLGEDNAVVPLPTRTPMIFSADGRALIVEASNEGKQQLYLRSLDRPDARPIAGTEGARMPFLSPDGKWIGFWAASALSKVPVDGGTPTAIWSMQGGAGALGPFGATWGADGTIVFSHPVTAQLMRVPAGGGMPSALTPTPRAEGRMHVTPFMLPDAQGVLFSDVNTNDATDSHLMFQSLEGGAPRKVLDNATDARTLPSGRLAFMRLGTLMTVGFDAAHVAKIGDPVPAMSAVMQSGLRGMTGAQNTGAGMYAVSSTGTLALINGPVTGGAVDSLVWATRQGMSPAELDAGKPMGTRLMTRVSPNGSQAAVSVTTAVRRELWLMDFARVLWTRCDECGTDMTFEWLPDARRIVTGSRGALVVHTLDRSAPAQTILREPNRSLIPADWLKDGRVVYESTPDGDQFEVKLLESDGKTTRVLLPLGAGENATASPDGRWLAYHVPGVVTHVFVQTLAASGGRVQVSGGNSTNAMWSADGRTLYYLERAGTPGQPMQNLFAVDISGTGTPVVGPPREVLHGLGPQTCVPERCYSVTPDGMRFLMRDSMQMRESVTRIDLVFNWTATLPQ